MAGLINPQSPTDFQIQQQAIERQRKVIDLLRQQSMTPTEGQMVSGRYVAPSFTQHVSKLAQALMSGTGDNQLNEKQRDLLSQQNKFMGDQADELRNSMTPRDAMPAETFASDGDGMGPTGTRPEQPAYTPTQKDITAAIVKYLNNTGNSTKAADYVVSDAKNQMLVNAVRGGPAPQSTPASGAGQISSATPIGGNNGRVPGVGPSAGAQSSGTQPSVGVAPASAPVLTPQNAYQLMDPQQKNIVDSYLAAGKPEDAIKFMGDSLKPHMSSDGKMMVYRGSRAVVVPGSVEAFGSFKREEKQYDAPIVLKTETGAEVQLSPIEYADYTKSGKLPLRLLPENVRAGIQAEADSSGTPGSVNIRTRQGTVGGEITPRLGVSQTTAGKQQQEKQGTFFGDTYADLQKKGMASNDSVAKYKRLSSLLEGVDTGKFTGTTLEIKKAARAAGFDLGVADNVAPLEAARALTSEMALVARNPDSGMGMPGAMSDADRNFLVNMQPGIETTPEGRKLQIEALMKMEQRKQEIARLAREYKNGQLDNGFFQVVQDYANGHPLFEGVAAPTSVPTRGAASMGSSVDYQKLYGIKKK